MNEVNKRLVLNWRPREENSYADNLTNGVFSRSGSYLRVQCRKVGLGVGSSGKTKSLLDFVTGFLEYFHVHLIQLAAWHS